MTEKKEDTKKNDAKKDEVSEDAQAPQKPSSGSFKNGKFTRSGK